MKNHIFIYETESFSGKVSENINKPETMCSTDSISLGLGYACPQNLSPITIHENNDQRSEFFRFLDVTDKLMDGIRQLCNDVDI